MGTRSGNTMDEKFAALLSNFVHFEAQIAQIPALTKWISRVDSQISKTLGDFETRLPEWNRISVLSPHVCVSSRHLPPQHQMYPVRQDPGLRSNKLTAPQPLGPMAQDHLMTTETRDEDLIRPQAPKTNNHEVPFYYDSLAN